MTSSTYRTFINQCQSNSFKSFPVVSQSSRSSIVNEIARCPILNTLSENEGNDRRECEAKIVKPRPHAWGPMNFTRLPRLINKQKLMKLFMPRIKTMPVIISFSVERPPAIIITAGRWWQFKRKRQYNIQQTRGQTSRQ